MQVTFVRLWNLRNHSESEFRPAAGTTLVVGENGAGKTTILEATGLFSTLSSPRSGPMGAIVREGAEEGGAKLETGQGVPLEIRIRGGRTLLRAGGVATASREFLGRFRCVLFTPEDLDLVRGEPELRRRALDELLVQLRPAHRGTRQELERALRQRNAALRYGREREAAVYNAPLAAAAAKVLAARRRVVHDLTEPVRALYAELAGRGDVEIRYRDSSEAGDLEGERLVEHLERRYAEGLARDLERGRTGIGPHRDDLELTVDGRPARTHASRGEQRSVALALRLAELGLLPEAPLLLDDVLSELDPDRRRRVFEASGDRQTIITATDRETVPAAVKVESTWRMDSGVLDELT